MSPSEATRPLLVIGPERVAGDEGTYPVVNPVRPAEVVAQAPHASLAQLDAAVAAARQAAPGWAATPPGERAALLQAAADAGAKAVADLGLAPLFVREHGKVLWEAEFDLTTPAAMAAVFAAMADEALAPRSAGSSDVEAVPFGVVAAVIPFNWPVSVTALKIVPALLAGNTVVVKAPPTCPVALLGVLAAMAGVLPPGVLNALNAPGPELGRALVRQPGVDMVSFTGGVGTGKAVMEAAASHLAPVVLELGGNDPAILAPDVEMTDALADRIHGAVFTTSGQVCMAIKRLYVHEDRVRDTVDALVERLSREVVGDGLADGVTMGPLHTQRARDYVDGLVREAEEGGSVAHRPATLRPEDAEAGGWLMAPAIVEGAPEGCGLVREEQFGPALPVLAYRDLDDAVARANGTRFGLCASVWTHDDALAAEVSRRLEAGVVWVNHHGTMAVDPGVPFGGWKESGMGHELGPDGIRAYTRPRSVTRHALP
jgi:acyl-CoA reductase-like NAD-dependent aldehyde dehydrogenase